MVERRVVLLADRVKSYGEATYASRTLEMASDAYFYPLMEALRSIAPQVIHYTSPEEFTAHIKKHTRDVVLSIWSGERSRNRRVLVPAICEANGIPYVGADAYLQAVCQDKELGKLLCAKEGFKVPGGYLLYSSSDYGVMERMHYPILIKPNGEGGSIGIFVDSVVKDYFQARTIADKLLPIYCPLLAEEYISGEEVSICMAGADDPDLFQVIRQRISSKTSFSWEIMDAEHKKITEEEQGWDCITDRISPSFREKLTQFYRRLGKVELVRLDGRWNENGFFVIELSVDCGLSLESTMYQAFQSAGFSYSAMLERLLENTLKAWEARNASMR